MAQRSHLPISFQTHQSHYRIPSKLQTHSAFTHIDKQVYIVEIKCQLEATDVFIADLIACSTCFGHHYAHHQELESIIQLAAACGLWCLVFELSVWCGAEGCVRFARNMLSKQ
jgi:hypothetical protein